MRETKVILDGAGPLTIDDFVIAGPDRGLRFCRARVVVGSSYPRFRSTRPQVVDEVEVQGLVVGLLRLY